MKMDKHEPMKPSKTRPPISKWHFHFKRHSLERFDDRLAKLGIVQKRELRLWLREFKPATTLLKTAIRTSCPNSDSPKTYLFIQCGTIYVVAVCKPKHHVTERNNRVDCVVSTFLTYRKIKDGYVRVWASAIIPQANRNFGTFEGQPQDH